MSLELDLSKFEENFEIPLSDLITEKEINSNSKEKPFTYSECENNDATSSIYFTENNITVLISIYGPKETKFREKIKPNKSNIEVYTKFSTDISKKENMDINYKIQKYLKSIILTTSYPKCQINVNIMILSHIDLHSNIYSLYATIYNGLSFAFTLSGIDMKALALSKSFKTKDNKNILIILDANDNDNIYFLESDKPLSNNETEDLILQAKNSNEELYKDIKHILLTKLKNI